MGRSELAGRLPVVVLGIPLVLVMVYMGGWILGGLIAAMAVAGSREYYGLASQTGARPFTALGVVASGTLVLLATESPVFETFAVRGFVVLLTLALGCLILTVLRRWPGGAPISSAATTVAGATYVGAALAFAPLLRHVPGQDGTLPTAWTGTAFLIFPVAITWLGDSCAYFGGRAWGRRKLIPAVSPGKTVAGCVASVVGSIAGAVLYVALFLPERPDPARTLMLAGLMGLILSAAGQAGDLVVSVAKREAGVKDSGRLFPGHGGALDRLDALFFTIPLAYALLRMTGWTG